MASVLADPTYMNSIEEILHADWLAEGNWPGRAEAFRQIHFPESEEDGDRALQRFKFEEAFLLQLLCERDAVRVSDDEYKQIALLQFAGDLYGFGG